MDKILVAAGALFIGLLVIVAGSLIAAIFTKWGFNYGVAPVFGFSAITFWQAFFMNLFLGMVGRNFQSTLKTS